MPGKQKPTFSISGHIEGGIVNIGGEQNISGTIILNAKSRLEGVTQSIGVMPNAEQSAKDEIVNLVNELKAQLEKSPPNKAEDTEQVARQVETLIKEASAEKPNKETIKIAGENLKKAAQNLADVMPIVLSIATQILTRLLSMIR